MPSIYHAAILQQLSCGPASATQLGAHLKVSQPTLSRALRPLESTRLVLRLGGPTRGARYARLRKIEKIGSSWPIFCVDTAGAATRIATLHAIEPAHFVILEMPDRFEGAQRFDNPTQGLPYFLHDMVPSGFLGVEALHQHLKYPEGKKLEDWGDDTLIAFLIEKGFDTPGNLILGEAALARYLAGRPLSRPQIVQAHAREKPYMFWAPGAHLGMSQASLLPGAQPKFTACVESGKAFRQVIVKFSPLLDSPQGVRWADLLIAESHASRLLKHYLLPAANTELLKGQDTQGVARVFLESERFDRVGEAGRRGVVSLRSLDLARYGALDTWSAAAARLHGDGLLSKDDLDRVRVLDCFGRLIANTDRHLGNLAFYENFKGPFELAPVYDMLPMLFAPRGPDLPDRLFKPTGPLAHQLDVWHQCCSMAINYWSVLCEDLTLSEGFRHLCLKALDAVKTLQHQGTGPASLELTREHMQNLLSSNQWFTHFQVAGFLGPDLKEAEVGALRRRGELLGCWDGTQYLYPAVQFDPVTHHLLPQVQKLLSFLPEDRSGWSQAFWLFQGHTLLDGRCPADVLQSDPAAAIEATRSTYHPDGEDW